MRNPSKPKFILPKVSTTPADAVVTSRKTVVLVSSARNSSKGPVPQNPVNEITPPKTKTEPNNERYSREISSVNDLNRDILLERAKTQHSFPKCEASVQPFQGKMKLEAQFEGHKSLNIPKTEFPCDICNYVSKKKRILEAHFIRKHTDVYNFSCEVCGKAYKIKNDLRTHVVKYHSGNPPVVCDVCGKSCVDKHTLKVHQKFAHYKPEFKCSICPKRLVSRKNLEQHVRWHSEKVICEECGKTFSEKCGLAVHMRTHTGDKPYPCPVCGKPFARSGAQRQHILTHTGQRPYVCDICGKSFTQKPGLICHRKTHPGPLPPLPPLYIEDILNKFKADHLDKYKTSAEKKYQWSIEHDQFQGELNGIQIELNPIPVEAKSEDNVKTCEICKEKFHFVTRLVAHLRIAHGIQRPFKCNSCWRTYAQQFMLNAHIKKSHTPKNVSCLQCKFVCVTKADLERHRKKQHELRLKFYCEVCGESFNDKDLFVAHTAMHNFIEYPQCNGCGITFGDASTLKQHRTSCDRLVPLTPGITKIPDSEHKCDLCGKCYEFKSALKQHKVEIHGIHAYERPRRRYLCALCGKELKTAKGFEIHNRSHTGEKPYTCEVCGKCFACETLLRTHNVTHTGERKYTCDQCGKSFTQRSTLVVHKRYHTGERPYVCPKCGKGFVTRTILNTHLKSCR